MPQPPTYGLLKSDVGGCDDWLSYHKQLVAYYGGDISKANETWSKYWDDQSFWALNKSVCKYSSDEWANYFSDAFKTKPHLLAQIVNTAQDVTSGTLSTASFVSKNLKWILLGAGVLVLIIALPIAKKAK